jgi:hypothetical protein
MLAVVIFATDKRFELVEAGRMGKFRAPLSLPLPNLLLYTQCGQCYRLSLLTVMRTGWLVATGGGGGEVVEIHGTSFRGLSYRIWGFYSYETLNCDTADLRRGLVIKVSVIFSF